MVPRFYRVATPARDFLEARGLSWGPWSPVLHVPLGARRLKASEFDKRAKRLAALAWHEAQGREWYWAHRDQARAAQATYRARQRAARQEPCHAMSTSGAT